MKTQEILDKLDELVKKGEVHKDLLQDTANLLTLLTNAQTRFRQPGSKGGFDVSGAMNGDPEHDRSLLNSQGIWNAMPQGIDVQAILTALGKAVTLVGGYKKAFGL